MKVGRALPTDELLHRQVNPKFVVEGRITSEAFQPTKKDKGLLSVNQGSMRSGEECHRIFLSRGWSSWGTLTVMVSEVNDQQLGAFEAPLLIAQDPGDLVDDDTHAVIDFRSLNDNRKQIEKRARKLRDAAVARGPYEAQQHFATTLEISHAEYDVAMQAQELPASSAVESPLETLDSVKRSDDSPPPKE